MRRTWKGFYKLTHPEKYVGVSAPIYRSSWELSVMQICDNNPGVLQWASEAMKIPYTNPLTGKHTVYIPDFFVVYEDVKGNKKIELWEVKPVSQTLLTEAKKRVDKLALVLNEAKWRAARAFASKNGMTFRIITERDLFR